MLFFRCSDTGRPDYILRHLREQVDCLSRNFNVVVIDAHECDYAELCERYQPALAMFESGIYTSKRPRQIARVHTHAAVAKIGFCHSDAYCDSRSVFLSDMARWGIDTFFTISVSMAEYTPPIADRLFVWPNFADGNLYKDYGQLKLIPVLLTGSFAAHYPWRNRIAKLVGPRYPTMACPHFGWNNLNATSGMLFGEQYARLLNAACVTPACGTIAHEVVRKHFEIPASGCCLLAERTPGLEAAGFRDMENCVFASSADVLDRLDYLFANPDRLAQITRAGFELVHRRHTIEHRDQIAQWWRLHSALRPGEAIVQPGPFEPLVVVPRPLGQRNGFVVARGVDRMLLEAGDDHMARGDFQSAEQQYRKCLALHYIPEAMVRLVQCRLLMGDAAGALRLSLDANERLLHMRGAFDPDPVEWAYLVVVLLCQGRVNEAHEHAYRYNVTHPALEGVRRVVDILSDRGRERVEPATARSSIHPFSLNGPPSWYDQVTRMLSACGKSSLAASLRNAGLPANQAAPAAPRVAGEPQAVTPPLIAARLPRETLRTRASQLTRKSIKGAARLMLSTIERHSDVVLPFRLSSMMGNDPLFTALFDLARQGETRQIVMVGHVAGRLAEACLSGALHNGAEPRVIVVGRLERSLLGSARQLSTANRLHTHDRPGGSTMGDHDPPAGTLVVVDDVTVAGAIGNWLKGDVVVISPCETDSNAAAYTMLSNDAGYSLVEHDIVRVPSYAVFVRGAKPQPRTSDALSPTPKKSPAGLHPPGLKS